MKKNIIYTVFFIYVVVTVGFIAYANMSKQPPSYKEDPHKYEELHIKVFHDSKGREHRVAVVYCGNRLSAVDIDATTYLEGDTTNVLNKKK